MHFEYDFPHIITPELLMSDIPEVRKMFRDQFKKSNPEQFQWRWIQGIELEKESPKSSFANPLWWWINQKYKIGNGRIFENIEYSTAHSYIELGESYRLLCGLTNPHLRQKLASENVLELEFLYQKPGTQTQHDGVRRVKDLIKHIQVMPHNTCREIVLQPMGSEMINKYSPQYDCLEFVKTNHTTRDLIKMYKRVLGIQPTPVTHSVWPEGTYFFWRAKYEPIDCIYSKEECTCPEIYEDIDKQEDIDRRLL